MGGSNGSSILSSMKAKLILVMSAVCIVPLLIAIVISYVSERNIAQDNAMEINQTKAEYVENDIQKTLEASFRAMEQLAAAPSVQALIADPENEALLEDAVEQLQILVANAGDGNSTVITGADGMNVARSTGNFVDISAREYFQQAMKGIENVSELSVSKTTGARIIVPAVPVYDEDGNTVIGVISRNYDVDYLHDILASLAGKGQTISIMDASGNVIAKSDIELTADDEVSMADIAAATAGNSEGSFLNSFGGTKYVVSYVKESMTNWIIVVTTEYNVIMSESKTSAIWMLIIGIILAVVAVCIAFWFGNAIDKPITVIDESLDALADGRFIDVDKYQDRKDEFGTMIRNVNAVIDKLRDIVAGVRNTANDLENDSNGISADAAKISGAMEGISEAVNEIASGATQQAEEIQNASANMQVISDNIESVASDAGSLAGTAETMNEGSKDSQGKLRDLQKSSEQMASAIERITRTIQATSAAVDNISSKVEAIDSIASQTSLLALNASIEAARAGEAGRGFAVVAEEIGKLASDSANSASEIKVEMNNLLVQSQEAVKVADDVSSSNKEQYEIIESTVGAIQNLIDGIEATVGGVENINGSAEAADSSKAVVVDAMNNLSAISEENAASTEETSASVEEINATLSELASETHSLKDHADTLMNEVAFFKD